jgi:hypothetical protein
MQRIPIHRDLYKTPFHYPNTNLKLSWRIEKTEAACLVGWHAPYFGRASTKKKKKKKKKVMNIGYKITYFYFELYLT